MPNVTITNKNAPGIVAKLSAGTLADKAMFCKTVDKEDAAVFGRDFENAQPGDTIQVKKPSRYIVGSSLDLTSAIQDNVEEKVPLVLDKVCSIGVKMSSLEIAYDKGLEKWKTDFLDPAMNAIAADMDKWLLDKAVAATYNQVGTASVQPAAILTYLQANQKLTEFLAPEDNNRFAFLTPSANTATSDARKGLFQNDAEIAKIYKMGYVGQGQGMTYVQSNLLPTLSNGGDVTGIAVESSVLTPANGATTLGVDGVGTGLTIKKGMTFTIAGVNAVHPLTKQDLGYEQQFTVTADVTEVASNQVIIPITPTIYDATTGKSLQNVSALPADEAALTFYGVASTAYQKSLALHKSAMRLCTVPLHIPKNQEFASRATQDGISVAVVRGFDIRTREEIMRFDVLAGGVAVRPEWMSRISS
jgi:hypothetical protein